jgi:hypothetical protein
VESRLLITVAMSLAVASSVHAQIVRAPVRSREPKAWVTGAVGYEQLGDVVDGSTQSTWRFGDAVQYRVSLEKPLQSNAAVGLAATFSQVPLTYQGNDFTGACAGSCDANANVTQLLALFHAGGNTFGFSQIINLAVGARVYSNFRERVSGGKIGPTKPDPDVTFQFGYGFGYGFSPDFQLQIVQDLATTIHQRTGLAGGDRTMSQQYTTRIGIRYALGR